MIVALTVLIAIQYPRGEGVFSRLLSSITAVQNEVWKSASVEWWTKEPISLLFKKGGRLAFLILFLFLYTWMPKTAFLPEKWQVWHCELGYVEAYLKRNGTSKSLLSFVEWSIYLRSSVLNSLICILKSERKVIKLLCKWHAVT